MKKLLPLLLLSLLLAACQTNPETTGNVNNQQSPATVGTTAATTAPSTSTTTEPTDPPTNTINNARKITVGMIREDVYELLHIHGETLFSDVIVENWALDDGKLLYIWFHALEDDLILGGYEISNDAQNWPGEADDSLQIPVISAELTKTLYVSMKQQDVHTNLGSSGAVVCNQVQLVQYPLLNGGFALAWYVEIDGISTVYKIEVRGGALA